MEWAADQDFFSDAFNPHQRTQKILADIQRRTLAEQALLAGLNLETETLEILFSSPEKENAILPPELMRMMLESTFEANQILDKSAFEQMPPISEFFETESIQSVLLVPLNIHNQNIDALFLINYSTAGSDNRIRSFVEFISAMLALALQNTQLFSVIHDKDAELTGWSQQVGQRIQAGTRQILEKEFQYFNLFEEAVFGILIHSVSGTIIEANQIACRLFEFDKKAFSGKMWSDLVNEDSVSHHEEFFASILRSQQTGTLETCLRKNDGTVFEAEISTQRVRFRNKVALQTYIRDVSAQKALEEQLREKKEKYQVIMESSLVGAFVIRNGIIQFTNEKFEDLCGYAKDELFETDLLDLISPEDRSMVSSREMRREKGEDVPDQYEIRFNQKEGDTWWGEVRARLITLDGKTAILVNVIDITQRKRLEMQLFETQKMESIGTLAGGIAHDFNNLLGGILGYASLLLSDMPKDHIYYEDIHTIAETAKEAADLTNRLLAFARGGKYQVTSIDSNRIVRDVVAILSRTIDRSVAIETHLVKNLWNIKGDSQQIHQALLNVCLNSVDAMPGGGRMTLSTANVILDEAFAQTQMGMKPGDYVRITVSDTGIGMDEKTKSRIFEPFFTTKPMQAAKGLGLSMVYGIIKNHEGSILVDSELGTGSKFTIYLPQFRQENQSTPEPNVQSQGTLNEKILLVDDEAVIRRVAKRMLERAGYEVIMAKDGKEAISAFEMYQNEIRIVLMDLIMPEMNGPEAAEKLREINADVKIIFASGYGLKDHPELKNHDEKFFIQKPFQTEILIQTIQHAIS